MASPLTTGSTRPLEVRAVLVLSRSCIRSRPRMEVSVLVALCLGLEAGTQMVALFKRCRM